MKELLELVLKRGLPKTMNQTATCYANNGRHPLADQFENARRGRTGKITPEEIERMQQLRRTGMTYERIAETMGINESTVRRRIG